MASQFLDQRISALAGSQLPDHIRHNYETFVFFAEAYYEYLEQKKMPQEIIQNIQQYASIDDSVDEFVEYFYKNYCADFPLNPEADKKLTLKKINELYQHKGSEKAVRLLFRLLYNSDVEFYYPEIQVLKGSGGRWKSRLSIRVNGNFNRVKNLIGQRIVGSTSGATARVVDAQLIDSIENIIEIFLDRTTLSGEFSPYENVAGNWPGQSNELFVIRVFNTLLLRDPTESESLAWVLDLRYEDKTPYDLIFDVALSEECENTLADDLTFMKAFMPVSTGTELSNAEYANNFGPRLLSGVGRQLIVEEVLATKLSEEFLKNVRRSNDTIQVTANVRPVVSNVTVVDRGYNYNVGDYVYIDTDVRGNNGLRGRVDEISYFIKQNFDANLSNAGNLTYGIVNIALDDYDTVNVTYANANLILSRDNLALANTLAIAAYANDMPNLHVEISAGNLSLSYGQRANIQAKIGAHCEYPGDWKRDRRSGVTEGLISLPESKFGGMVLRGRRDDGTFEDNLNRFLDDVYFYMFDREPTFNERIVAKSVISSYDAARLTEGFGEIIVRLVQTPEFLISDKYLNITRYIETLYQVALGRFPETSGFQYWYNEIKNAGYTDAIKITTAANIAQHSAEAKLHYERTYGARNLIKQDVYYQPFSYEIQTSENINVWREIVKKLVHPAGLVFFGRNKIFPPGGGLPAPPAGKLPPKTSGIGSIQGIHQYLNVAIRLAKSLPTLATVATPRATQTKQILSSVTRANANISYIGAGPRYETIDKWKFSYSATVDGQDLMYAQVLANISLSAFDAANIRDKYDITPPLYSVVSNVAPWTYSLVSSSNTVGEGQVVVFTVNTGNVPDGTRLVYVIEESGTLANTDLRKGDIAYLLDGLIPEAPIANAVYLQDINPVVTSGYYYVDWTV